ncbi:predicted protein [Botrytis cinerea T4]|uniref:Uncharacterized protein n=1 Tax=Botryotinia fuckeliana (strain T4) TaxID=999810 RepID=G2Y6U4_BOTF4|nr:predicted protein [Botrytis cinerea T4]
MASSAVAIISLGNNQRCCIIDTYEKIKEPPQDIDLVDMDLSRNIPLDLLELDITNSRICDCSISVSLPITCCSGNVQVEFRTGNPDHLCRRWEVIVDDP